MKEFYMIASTNGPSSHRHYDLEEARKEVRRLQRKHGQSIKFIIMVTLRTRPKRR